jgi:lysophospholipase L1-like esterase
VSVADEIQQFDGELLGVSFALPFNLLLYRSLDTGDVVTPPPSPSSELLPLHSRVCFEGDSITKGSNGPTFIEFALMRSLGRYYAPIGYNRAVGGETLAQMSTTTETGQVAATNPKVVVLLGGTNDLGGSGDSVSTIFGNLRTCIAAYKAAGAQVVNLCVLPRVDPLWLGMPQRETDRRALNALIRAQTDVIVVDLESTFDPDTMTITNSAQDTGLHPNYLGAITIGNAVGDALNTLIVADTPINHSFESQNLMLAMDNPQLTGTAGGLSNNTTGVIATDWVLDITANSGLTVVGSKTTLNGQEAQMIVVSGTNALASPASVNLRNIINFTGSAIGDLYDCWWDFALSGTQNLGLIAATAGTTVAMPISSIPQNTLIPDDTELSGVIRIPSVAALAAQVTSINSQVVLTFGAGAECAAQIVLASPYLAKVPAGQ